MALHKVSSMFYVVLLSVIFGVASVNGYSYGPNQKAGEAKIKEQDFLPSVFSVQGIIYCKSGSKLYPLKGGVVRIACLAIDKHGYETAPFSVLTRATDANGYFLSKLSTEPLEKEGYKISQCKAFLYSSPLKTCQVVTDSNLGLSGAPLTNYRLIGSSNLRLYSVGPFVYS